jgi:hypothetical protein
MEEQLKAILKRLDKLDMKIDMKIDMGFDDLKEVMERQQQEKRQGFADINKAIDMLNKRLKGEGN